MARVGELLVAMGWITAEQCVQGLNTQVLWGARLGTNLIELGFVDVDQVARVLGRQHECPPALSHHFAAADRALQRELPIDMAERWSCIPLSRSKQGRLVLAAAAPFDDVARAVIAHELGVRPQDVTVAIAPELRVRYQLERIYGIQRDTRFMRVRGPTPMQPPTFDIHAVEVGPELEIPEDKPRAMSRQAMPPLGRGTRDNVERRQYAPTIGEQPVAKLSIKRLAIGSESMAPLSLDTTPPPKSSTLGEATRAIRCSSDRETVGELAIQAVAQFVPGTSAAMLLVVRGSIAVALVGFSRSAETLPEVIVPLSEPGLVPAAIEQNATLRAAAGELGVVDALVLSAMGASDDLVVAPVSIGNGVVGVIAMAVAPDESVNADAITAAAGAAYARLMREATR